MPYRNHPIRNIIPRSERPLQRDLFIENRERLRALRRERGNNSSHGAPSSRDIYRDDRRVLNTSESRSEGRYQYRGSTIEGYRRSIGLSGSRNSTASEKNLSHLHSENRENYYGSNGKLSKSSNYRHEEIHNISTSEKIHQSNSSIKLPAQTGMVLENTGIEFNNSQDKSLPSVQSNLSKITILESLAGPSLYDLILRHKTSYENDYNNLQKNTPSSFDNTTSSLSSNNIILSSENHQINGNFENLSKEYNLDDQEKYGLEYNNDSHDYILKDMGNGLIQLTQNIPNLESIVLEGFMDDLRQSFTNGLVNNIGLVTILPEDIFAACVEDYRDLTYNSINDYNSDSLMF
jgi:hypothetical protein